MEERIRSSDVPWSCYVKDITLHPGPVGNEIKELTGDALLGIVPCGAGTEHCVYIRQRVLQSSLDKNDIASMEIGEM